MKNFEDYKGNKIQIWKNKRWAIKDIKGVTHLSNVCFKTPEMALKAAKAWARIFHKLYD